MNSVKLNVLLIVLFFGVALPSSAQLLIGPTGGLNYSWVRYDDVEERSRYKVTPVLSYHAGFNVSFRVQKRFFLHTSLIYSKKGKIIENKVDDQSLRNEVVYNYIELPILYTVEYKIKAKGNKEFKMYFGMGPNISYWLGGKGTFYNSELRDDLFEQPRGYKIVFGKDPEKVGQNEMVIQSANRLQLGINFSAGFVFEPIHLRQVMLTLRYELGHSYLSRTSQGAFSNVLLYQDNLQVRNQGFRISLAYLIDLRTSHRKKGKSTFDKSR